MWIVVFLYFSYIGLNVLGSKFITRCISHPKYSLSIADDLFAPYSAMILFIGFPILLFRKQLYRKRLREYYEWVSEHKMNDVEDFGLICGVDISKEEIENLNRTIKLEELNRKIRRKKLWL